MMYTWTVGISYTMYERRGYGYPNITTISPTLDRAWPFQLSTACGAMVFIGPFAGTVSLLIIEAEKSGSLLRLLGNLM